MTRRDMSVFDDVEEQARIFDAVRYLERNAIRRKRRSAVTLTALGVSAGLIGTVAVYARLLLAGGDYSTGGAIAVAAVGTVPLLLGLGSYIAGLEYLRVLDRNLERTDPAPLEPLLGVVSDGAFFWSSSQTGSTRL